MKAADVQNIIDSRSRELSKTTSVIVFEVKAVDVDPEGVLVTGTMLLERHKRALLGEIRAACDVMVIDRIATCEQFPKGLGVCDTLAPVMAAPGGQKLVSEVRPGEQVKVLILSGDQSLVLLEDGAAGWVRSSQVSRVDPRNGIKWQHASMIEGQLAPDLINGLQFCDIGGRYLDVPYVLGGRSTAGIDCSALTQLVYLEVSGRLLPRHSWDQKAFGREIAASLPKDQKDRHLGDLAFAVSTKTGEKHVGIYFGEDRILHASRTMKKVATWDLKVFCKLYTIASWRRLLTIEVPGNV